MRRKRIVREEEVEEDEDGEILARGENESVLAE